MFIEAYAYTNLKSGFWKNLERFGRGAVRDSMFEAAKYANGLIRRNMNPIVYDVYRPKVYQRTYTYARSWFAFPNLTGNRWYLSLGNLARDPSTGEAYGERVEFGVGPKRMSYFEAFNVVRSIVGNRHFVPRFHLGTDQDYGWGRMPPRPLMTAVLWATHNWLIQKGLPTLSLTRIASEFLGPYTVLRLANIRRSL